MGIPISILGTFAIIYSLGLSLNSISLFGFIIALGIIVDDAIVVAEDSAYLEQQGLSSSEAAMQAAKRMFPSVLAASLTTVAAFLPLILIGGNLGRFLIDIPIVICAAIVVSLIECFLILPGHLAHQRQTSSKWAALATASSLAKKASCLAPIC